MEAQIKLATQGRDKYLSRGKYDKEFFELVKDDEDNQQWADRYGWDFSKSFEDQDFMKEALEDDEEIYRGYRIFKNNDKFLIMDGKNYYGPDAAGFDNKEAAKKWLDDNKEEDGTIIAKDTKEYHEIEKELDEAEEEDKGDWERSLQSVYEHLEELGKKEEFDELMKDLFNNDVTDEKVYNLLETDIDWVYNMLDIEE